MANEQNTEIQDLSVEELKDRANSAFEDNKNLIIGVIGGIIIFGLGIYYYSQMYMKPREAAAQVELYKAEAELKRDSFALALTGRNVVGQANNFIGLVGVIEEYSGTKAANLAHYYAGAASLRLDQHQLALDYLGNFSGEELLQTQAYTMMGDAASELKSFDVAMGHYQKAAASTENIALKIHANYKQGKLLEMQKKNAEAKKMYQDIMAMDSQIGEGLGVDKDLIRLK